MSHFPDEQTIQRCVDGELTETEHQAFLRELERHPSGWRDVALAYMEDQLWAKASRDYIRTPPAPMPATTTPEPPRTSPYRWLHHTALAASTLIAIGLGYLGGSQKFQSSQGDLAASGSPIVINNGGSYAGRGTPAQLTSTNSGVSENASPLAVYPNWLPPRLSDAERQRLHDEGYQIFEDPQLYTVPIENNRHLVLPVNNVRIQQPLQ